MIKLEKIKEKEIKSKVNKKIKKKKKKEAKVAHWTMKEVESFSFFLV
jgi:hypothetical protein